MSKKSILNQIKTLLSIEVKLEQMKLDNGTTIEADAFEPDYEVFVVSGEDRVALPVGEYTLEDGKMLVIAQEGIISEIKEAVEEEAPAPVEEEVPVAAENQPAPSPKKVIESISKELFFSEIEKLRNEIEELKSLKKEELSKVEVVEEVVEEEVKPLVHNPEKLSKQKVNVNKLSLVEFLNNRKK